jgi:excisionase family DNA binding protein
LKQLVTPKQVAQAINVSESSLKRWCDRGLLKTVRTAGGHRRLALADVLEFLRTSGQELVNPSLLGLPSTVGRGELPLNRAHDQLRGALITGDVELCRRIVFDLHLAGRPVSKIFDDVIAAAMHDIGDCWERGEAEIYQERRASMLCLRLIAELRSVIPPAGDGAPIAIGATPECDPYSLPTMMAEIVLRQQGWKSQSLGSRLPFKTLIAAIRDLQPSIFWFSVSHIDDEEQFVAEYRGFYDQVRTVVPVVVGGRALNEPLRRDMEYTAFGDKMLHLESVAETLKRSIELTQRSGSGAE